LSCFGIFLGVFFFQICVMSGNDYGKRFLRLHNAGVSRPTSTKRSLFRDSKTPPNEGDRFIPLHEPSIWQSGVHHCNLGRICQQDPTSSDLNEEVDVYRALVSNELFDTAIDDLQDLSPNTKVRRLFEYSKQTTSPSNMRRAAAELTCPLTISPLSPLSQRLLVRPRRSERKIYRTPYKILDAPELQDDFYLNLVDWSKENVLAVGLGSSVYLWCARNGQVTKLCDMVPHTDIVTAVSWAADGRTLAVGTQRGSCQIWDANAQLDRQNFFGHLSRIGCLAWNGDTVTSGSRDRQIVVRDLRASGAHQERRLLGHRQEVCGLKWSPDYEYMASGGNDNQLMIWTLASDKPIQVNRQHCAAVKAIAWSPHHPGLLVSGGGTADRCLKFWNTLTGQPVRSVDTGSQVCNVLWSRHSDELVSTHGYSQNQILVWKYPTLDRLVKLVGHSSRVLYLSMSPDGESIVTGAGDETLRFWRVFEKDSQPRGHLSPLATHSAMR
ncbi:Fizzy-related -like protein, partial [Trichinella britovi]